MLLSRKYIGICQFKLNWLINHCSDSQSGAGSSLISLIKILQIYLQKFLLSASFRKRNHSFWNFESSLTASSFTFPPLSTVCDVDISMSLNPTSWLTTQNMNEYGHTFSTDSMRIQFGSCRVHLAVVYLKYLFRNMWLSAFSTFWGLLTDSKTVQYHSMAFKNTNFTKRSLQRCKK